MFHLIFSCFRSHFYEEYYKKFFRNRLLAKAKLPILPIFEPIFTFSVLVECYAHVTKKNNGKIGLKIAQIGNLVALGDGF